MKTINNIQISVISGNIAQLEGIDAIIVPQFNNAVSYGGVGGAVYRAGMEEGLENYRCFLDNIGHEATFGTVVHTQSGIEDIPHLLHAVTVGSSREEAMHVVFFAIKKALDLARQNKIHALATPLLGTGIIGDLTEEQSLTAILNGIVDFDNSDGVVKEVKIVVFRNPDLTAEMDEKLKAYSPKGIMTEGRRQSTSLGTFIGSLVSDLEMNSGFNNSKD